MGEFCHFSISIIHGADNHFALEVNDAWFLRSFEVINVGAGCAFYFDVGQSFCWDDHYPTTVSVLFCENVPSTSD